MKGYWGQPEKTAQALRGGWLCTGDAGFIDRAGYVTMRGRFSELFSVAGVTWYPRDVEDALCELSGVLQAAVIGVPDQQLGARPMGCVTLAAGASLDEAEALDVLRAKLPYDLSRLAIRVLPAFPMTPTGKISKAQLADELLAAGT